MQGFERKAGSFHDKGMAIMQLTLIYCPISIFCGLLTYFAADLSHCCLLSSLLVFTCQLWRRYFGFIALTNWAFSPYPHEPEKDSCRPRHAIRL